MDNSFDFLNVSFFTKATVFPGSVGSFRYRFARTGWPGKPEASIQAWTYENVCFELAQEIETATFPWTEEGVEELRTWLQEQFQKRDAGPYRIPYPPKTPAAAPENG